MPRHSSTITDILHENNQYSQKSKRFYIWLPLNIIVLSILLHDIWRKPRQITAFHYFKHGLAFIISLNILYLCVQKLLAQFFPKKYHLSNPQFSLLRKFYKQLLDGKCDVQVATDKTDNRVSQKKEKIRFERFRISSPPLVSNTSTSSIKSDSSREDSRFEKYPIKYSHASLTSLFASTSTISDPFRDLSFNSSYDGYSGLSRTYDSNNISLTGSTLSKSFVSFNRECTDQIDASRRSIDGYDCKPKGYQMNENSGYWKSKDTVVGSLSDYRADSILNDVYQLSSTTTLESVKPVNEVSSLGANSSLCKKFNINQACISEWIANLRMWITQTILTRIIKEIEDVNQALTVHGVANVSIGSSGLERLKKTAAMSQVYHNIPSLSSLVSFLDISPNQEYIVQRISALSTGSMSNYCWNSGGAFEGKPWNENLPTDAALVMHLVAAYFDSQLFPLPHTAPDGRQFSSAHYVKNPAVPVKNDKSLIIYQQIINPPHFQLIVGENTYDISRGRNNLFHVLLFFLQHIKTKESGMFEHVNLGSSGINMLWIINEPSYGIYKKLS